MSLGDGPSYEPGSEPHLESLAFRTFTLYAIELSATSVVVYIE